MRVSLNQIKQYIDFALPPVDELVDRINSQLGGVGQITDLRERYSGAVIVRVQSCEKHPNADKLSVCQVDDGTSETTQVVCGASNVHTGMYAVWLKPGSTVPATADDKEPFVLGSRELRGEMSNGMLASPKELGLGDSHEGILEIHEHERTADGSTISAGVSFAKAFGLDDISIEIENKMFTHRPDLFGQLGVAREIAGIQDKAFASPDWYATGSVDTLRAGSETLPLAVFNESHENVPRFTAITMKNVHVKPSPLWLQCALVRMGGKPINNVVDLTNYIMLLTAQPTHAYDYDKIRGATIGARMATVGEKVTLLNGKTYALDTADVVIADAEGPIGLAGIMGGGDSEVSATTTKVVIEVANFNMYTLRKSSMRHGVFTDALTRFNKGQSPYQNIAVMNELVKLVGEIADGAIASELLDIGDGFDRAHDGNYHIGSGTVTTEFINARLGTELNGSDIATLLTNVEFAIENQGTSIIYRPPFWRTDIVDPEDIVEEVGRLYGFDKLPRVLPPRSSKPAARNPRRELKQRLRESLSGLGANEVLTYSFVNEKLLTKSGQDPSRAYSLSNALSPDLQYYRLSLTPSLLDKVAPNYRAGYDRFALFEFGKSHFKGEMDEHEPGVPNEDEHMAFVVAGNDLGGAAFYSAKRYFDQVVEAHGARVVPVSSFTTDDEWGRQLVAPYATDRSVVLVKDDQIWGVVGEFSEQVKKAFKLPKAAAGFEVHLDVVRTPHATYKPLSRFPGTSRDISIKVSRDVTYGQVAGTLESVVSRLDDSFTSTVQPISIYSADDETDKTLTFRVSFVRHDRTLRDDEVNEIMGQVSAVCVETHQATIV